MLGVIKFAEFLIDFANLLVYAKEPTVEIRFEMQKSITAKNFYTTARNKSGVFKT